MGNRNNKEETAGQKADETDTPKDAVENDGVIVETLKLVIIVPLLGLGILFFLGEFLGGHGGGPEMLRRTFNNNNNNNNNTGGKKKEPPPAATKA